MILYLAIGGIACAGIAAVTDLRWGRIPNWLTYSAMLLGLALRGILEGWRASLNGLVAGLIAGAIFFVLFLLKGMGAGDVKLMTAIGVWVGLEKLRDVLVASALAGGILALAYMLARKQGWRTLRNIGSLFRFHAVVGLTPHPEINLENPKALRIPYAVAIAAGTFWVLGTTLMRG